MNFLWRFVWSRSDRDKLAIQFNLTPLCLIFFDAGQKDKKRGATASTQGKASFRGAAFKKARFTTGVTAVEEN